MKSLAAVLLSGAVSASLFTPALAAQTPQSVPHLAAPAMSDSRSQTVVDRAEQLFRQGADAFGRGDADRSRRYFDDAVDAILASNIDLRGDAKLRAYYTELIERVHKFQMAPGRDQGAFADQAYVPAESEIAKLSESDLASLGRADATFGGKYDFEFAIGSPVYQFINYFTVGRGRGTMETGLRRSGKYRGMAERIFKEEGVPTDLVWLAQVESVWKPAALSSAAAKGIWQFIPSTGKRFGLDQNQWLDERSNPEESTRAAARYLKWLYNYFGNDWCLAMAAYNSGEGNVGKAIARSGYADFWEIHRLGFLPTETRNYVPAILAVIIVSHNQERYGFNVTPEPSMTYDVAQLPAQTDLEVVADLCGASPEMIKDLNPELKRGATPPWGYTIKIPKGKKSGFETAYAALPPDQRIRRAVPTAVSPTDVMAAVQGANGQSGFTGANLPAVYVTQSGDTLESVATRHGVSATELARVNRIAAGSLKSGQTLQIPKATSYDSKNAANVTYRGTTDAPKTAAPATRPRE